MKLEVTVREECVIFELIGSIGLFGSFSFEPYVHKYFLLKSSPKQLIVDCKQLKHINSSGLHALLKLYYSALEYGTEVVFCNIQDNVAYTFSLGGVTDIFTIKPTVEEALLYFSELNSPSKKH